MIDIISFSDEILSSQKRLNALIERISSTGEASSAVNINRACEYLIGTKVGEITIAAVGKFCQANGGFPKTQSIRNKKHTLALLVLYWNEYYQLKSGGKNQRTRSGRISNNAFVDPAAVAKISILESELNSIRIENNRLRRAMRELKPMQIDASISMGHALPDKEMYVEISDVQKDSIRHFLSLANLNRFDLDFDDFGRIVSGPVVVMDAVVVTLLKKLLGSI